MYNWKKAPTISPLWKRQGQSVSQPASKQTTTRVCCIAAICASHIHRVFSFPPLYKKFYSSTDELLLCFGCLRWFSLLRFALTWPFIQTASQPASRPYVEFCSVLFSSVEFSSVVSVQSIRIQLKFLVQYYVACIVEYLLWLVACVSLVLVWSGL